MPSTRARWANKKVANLNFFIKYRTMSLIYRGRHAHLRPRPVNLLVPENREIISIPTHDQTATGIKENAGDAVWSQKVKMWRYRFVVPDLGAQPGILVTPHNLRDGIRSKDSEYYLNRDIIRQISFGVGKIRPAILLEGYFDESLRLRNLGSRKVLFKNPHAYSYQQSIRLLTEQDHQHHAHAHGIMTFAAAVKRRYPKLCGAEYIDGYDSMHEAAAIFSNLFNWLNGLNLRNLMQPAMFSGCVRQQTNFLIEASGLFYSPLCMPHEALDLDAYAIGSRPLRDGKAGVNNLQWSSWLDIEQPKFSLHEVGNFCEDANDYNSNRATFTGLYADYVFGRSSDLVNLPEKQLLGLLNLFLTSSVKNDAVKNVIIWRIHGACSDNFLTAVLLRLQQYPKYGQDIHATAMRKLKKQPSLAVKCLKLSQANGAPWTYTRCKWDEDNGVKQARMLFSMRGKRLTIMAPSGCYSVRDNNSVLEEKIALNLWARGTSLEFIDYEAAPPVYFKPDLAESPHQQSAQQLLAALPCASGWHLDIAEVYNAAYQDTPYQFVVCGNSIYDGATRFKITTALFPTYSDAFDSIFKVLGSNAIYEAMVRQPVKKVHDKRLSEGVADNILLSKSLIAKRTVSGFLRFDDTPLRDVKFYPDSSPVDKTQERYLLTGLEFGNRKAVQIWATEIYRRDNGNGLQDETARQALVSIASSTKKKIKQHSP